MCFNLIVIFSPLSSFSSFNAGSRGSFWFRVRLSHPIAPSNRSFKLVVNASVDTFEAVSHHFFNQITLLSIKICAGPDLIAQFHGLSYLPA